MDKDVKGYSDNRNKGNKNYAKYKKTGKPKYKARAKRYYTRADGYEKKLTHPATVVTVKKKKTIISNSFNPQKETVYGVNKPKVTLKKRVTKTKVTNKPAKASKPKTSKGKKTK